MLDHLYKLTRDIIKHIPGFTVNEVMNTDYRLLVDILFSEKKEKQDKVISLNEFVKSL